jgi:hypothetical protein
MKGEGPLAKQITDLFSLSARRVGLDAHAFKPTAQHFRRDCGAQLEFALS